MDRSIELQSVRELRKIAILGDLAARLTLCRLYAAGKLGGCSRPQAVAYVREFVQSSAVPNVRAVYSGIELTHSMRSVNTLTAHTHPFNGPLSGTTQVSRCQKGKTNLDFAGARDSQWQWHQLGHNASLHLAPGR